MFVVSVGAWLWEEIYLGKRVDGVLFPDSLIRHALQQRRAKIALITVTLLEIAQQSTGILEPFKERCRERQNGRQRHCGRRDLAEGSGPTRDLHGIPRQVRW